jgi:glycosyltransferase involved in cell wall biosynthesis
VNLETIMYDNPLVSIIVNNHNYGRFLRASIDSALGQTYQPVEVLVVDDGSTDDSRAIIAAYGDRVTPVLKPNGGQASAFNAGFERCRGAIVLFLDADDVLLPDIVARVVAAFRASPAAAKLHYRMAVIDARGEPTNSIKPPAHLPLPSGDLRKFVLQSFDDVLWQSTSGNAFAAWALRRIFPVPEDVYPLTGADYYVSNMPALFGQVLSLDGIGAYFRIHGSNNHHQERFDLDRSREIIRRFYRTHECITRAAEALGFTDFPRDPTVAPAMRFLAHRMASLKLEPERHPNAEDTLRKLILSGVAAALRRPALSLPVRLVYGVWFVIMPLAPRRLAWKLAEKHFFPEKRRQFTRLLQALHHSGHRVPSVR